ncbi:MAG TPA: hypothetical protein VKC89_02020 [Patescibacteria group bacterium]|nr:hypothetical protein [Patescibacteria group bacterium]
MSNSLSITIDTKTNKWLELNMAEGYGKRPLWQWILIYVIIGGIIYAGIYYFVIAKKSGSNLYSGTSTPTPSSTPSTQQAPSSAPGNPIIPKY